MMKKITALLLALTMTLAPCATAMADSGFAAFGGAGREDNQTTLSQDGWVVLDDLEMMVQVSDYVTIKQEDGFVYIYTQQEDAIPYIMVGRYDTTWKDVTGEFTTYMKSVYSGLKVSEKAGNVTISGSTFKRIVYQYKSSGYTVRDTRLFYEQLGKTYMFGSKQIESLNNGTISEDALRRVAGSFSTRIANAPKNAAHVNSRNFVYGSSSGTPAASSQGSFSQGSASASAQEDYSGLQSVTFQESMASFNGVWVDFEDGFSIYMPSSWREFEVSSTQADANVLYFAGDASGKAHAPYVIVRWTESDGVKTLDELSAAIADAGYQVDAKLMVNGIPCVSYGETEQDVSGIMFFHPMSRDYLLTIVAGEYSSNTSLQAAVLLSLSLQE